MVTGYGVQHREVDCIVTAVGDVRGSSLGRGLSLFEGFKCLLLLCIPETNEIHK